MGIKIKLRFSNAAAIAFGVLVAAFSRIVAADPCWLSFGESSVKSSSDLVFIGTAVAKTTEIFEAVELEGREHIAAERTTFRIESVEKGNITPGSELRVQKGEKCSCAGKFEVGKKYLVHARLLGTEKVPTLHFCDFNKMIE